MNRGGGYRGGGGGGGGGDKGRGGGSGGGRGGGSGGGDRGGGGRGGGGDRGRGGHHQGPPPRQPGDWECPDCRQNNYARNSHCFKCQASKTQAGGGGGSGQQAPQQRQPAPQQRQQAEAPSGDDGGAWQAVGGMKITPQAPSSQHGGSGAGDRSSFSGDRGRGGFHGSDRGGGGFRGSDRGGGGGFRGSDRGGGGGFRGSDRGGGGGFRGSDRGGGGFGGGGGGRGSKANITTSKDTLPKDVRIEGLDPMEWLDKDCVPKNLQPPGPLPPGRVKERQISLIVNHVPATIRVPKTIYHYDIDVDLSQESKDVKKKRKSDTKTEDKGAGSQSPQKKGGGGARGARGGGARGARGGGARPGRRDEPENPDGRGPDPPKPKLWKKIVQHVITVLQREHEELTDQPIHIATDGVKAMYTVKELEMTNNPSRSYQLQIPLVELNDPSENYPDTYIVTITYLSMIDTGALQGFLSNMMDWLQNHNGELPLVRTETLDERNQIVTRQLPFSKFDQIYNIVLKTLPMYTFTPVGRAAFFPTPPGDGFPLGGGLVNWSGHSLIFNFGWSTFVNIDIANSAFILGKNVLEVLGDLDAFGGGYRRHRDAKDVRNINTWQDWHFDEATKLLRTCKVSYEWRKTREKYTKRVSEVTDKIAEEHVFTSAKGQTNVKRYCEEEKGAMLNCPSGPCLKLGNSIVPAEFCTVEKGQVWNQKLAEAQTAAMIKDTAKPPGRRLESIQNALRITKFGTDPVLREFGVSVGTQLLTLQAARILPRPTLVYGVRRNPNEQSHLEPGPDGVWDMWTANQQFVRPYPGKISWGVLEISYGGEHPALRRFVTDLIKKGADGGLDLGTMEDAMRDYFAIPARTRNLDGELLDNLKYFQDRKYKFVLVVMPEKNTTTYAAIKKCAELKLTNGILTQCVASKNVEKCDHSTIGNIILKVNSKLGGQNNLLVTRQLEWAKIDILRCPVIIIGADVTHPQAGSTHPSFAAVTGSIDRTGMPYMMHTQAQRKAAAGAAEIIENLDTIMVKMLSEFIRRTGHKPRKIIVYRDGVGDGQFAEVLQKEMMPIREACRQIQADRSVMAMAKKDIKLGDSFTAYEPKITFIAVQKRHKTRFFPSNPNDGVGRPQNAPPGTVVDTDIVKPDAIDFYLLSHTGIQGTSRPTRYQVLWDDSEFNLNELELLSYFLCYMYCRCNRSVSYPAPTYYAHLAATRAKIHTTGMSDEQYGNIDRVNQQMQRQEQMIQEFPMHFV